MTGNIIGEPTEKFVAKEVRLRQQVYGAGSDGNARSTEALMYMNNRNAWIKLASGASVKDAMAKLPPSIPNSQLDLFKKTGLAKKALLFNGLSSLVAGITTQRQGVNLDGNGLGNSKVFNNSVYGLGGTEQGLQPMPGIESLAVDNKNRGSIRTATITLTAFNRFQFEIIESLYLRLGFTLLVEWGWDKYINPDTKKIEDVGNTVIENSFFGTSNQDDILREIKSYQEIYHGNYDGFFGRVTNFNWSFEDDGSYKITIKMSSLGDVVESFKINTIPNKNLFDEVNNLELTLTTGRLALLKKDESIISSEKASTKLGATLYKKLANNSLWESEGNKNYFNLHVAIQNDSSYKKIQTYKKDESDPEFGADSLDIKYCYYVSFGEMLRLIHEEILPDVNDGSFKHLEIDLDSIHTICSYTPNLISFDPKVCIIKMDDGYAYNQVGMTGIKRASYTKKLKPFVRVSDTGGLPDGIRKVVIEDKDSGERRSVLVRPSGTAEAVMLRRKIKNGEINDIDGNPVTLREGQSAIGMFGTIRNFREEIISIENSNDIQSGQLVWGEIHNIYLNYDVIFRLLKETVDKKGALTLFKFLVGICDEINSAFANILDIEPILKDDKIITFMDQKPVQGGSKNLKDLIAGYEDYETANLEVFGFDQTRNEGNFVKSLSFNTKISPKISNQLAIGATAAGTSVGEDATGYSNWNRGMIDRFQQIIEESDDETETDTSTRTGGNRNTDVDLIKFRGGTPLKNVITKEARTTKKTVEVKFAHSSWQVGSNIRINGINHKSKESNVQVSCEVDTETGKIIGKFGGSVRVERGKPNQPHYKDFEWNFVWSRFTNNTLQQVFNKATNSTWFAGGGTDRSANQASQDQAQQLYIEISKALAKAYQVQEPNFSFSDNGFWSASDSLNDQTTSDQDAQRKRRAEKRAAVSDVNYSAYLANMFGGKPNITNEQAGSLGIQISNIPTKEAKYTIQYNGSDFSNAGKNSYKMWLSTYTNQQYASEGSGASNQVGFIPVEFNLELDGISGFKIYNKIMIDQRILPSNYNEALEFLVKGLNHKIDGTGWTTNLETLSTSNLNVRAKEYNRNYDPQVYEEINEPSPSIPPLTTFEGSAKLQPIKDLIAAYETPNGEYNIANQGQQGGYRYSSTDVTTLPVGVLLNDYAVTNGNTGTSAVFAMGRYQVIPVVLDEAVTKGIIARSELFDPAGQEKVCDYLLLQKRKSQIGKYLSGKNNGSIEDLESAIDGLGQEWASMPVVSRTKISNKKVGDVVAGTGKAGYYGGDGINPTVSKTDVRTAVQKMIESRIKYSGKTPDFIPSYVTV